MTLATQELRDLACGTVGAVYADALAGSPCDVIWDDGRAGRLPVEAWLRVADATDRRMLASCVGTTLDIGCGPGRMSAQLRLDGHVALGIDVVPEAIAQARARGANALRRDVFGHVPGRGRWETALLADGNVGIGGDPVRLLDRVRALLAPSGMVVLEVAPYGTGLRRGRVTLRAAGQHSDPLPWAVLGMDAVAEVAASSGFVVVSSHEHGDRWWSVLRRAV